MSVERVFSLLTPLLQAVAPNASSGPTFEQTALIAIVSLAGGYGISLFRNRVLPWPAILGFSEQFARYDVVEIPIGLSEASARTWLTRPLQNESDRLGNVNFALQYGEEFLKTNKDAREALQTAIDRLRVAANDDEKVAALYPVAAHPGVMGLIGAAISRIAIRVPDYDDTLPIVLPYQYVQDDREGCVAIDFPDEWALVGFNLNRDVIFANRLVPFVESMSRVDTVRLIPVFEALLPILQTHTELHRTVVEHARPIVQPRTRWAAHLSISNYGATPFLLFPDKGTIFVQAKDMAPFYLPAKLMQVKDDENVVDVVGSHLIESGKTDRFVLLTTQTQSEMQRGDRLRALWEAGDGFGRAHFLVRGRELPFSIASSTSRISFKAATPL